MKINEINKLIPGKNSVEISGRIYYLPFKSSGNWVEDAKGKPVCDCSSYMSSKDIAAALNKAHQS